MKKYMRHYRAKQKGIVNNENTEETYDNTCNVNCESNVIEEREEEKKEKISRFTPPTVEEVRAYCEERGNNIDAQAFIDFYTASGWKRGNTPIKDWKACVRTWESRDKQPQAQGKPTQKTVLVWQGD